MNDYFATTVFFTLFFVIDPIGLIPVFIVYLAGFDKKKRIRVILKTIAISIFISLFIISIIQRMIGLILSALAVQFIVNGLKGVKVLIR